MNSSLDISQEDFKKLLDQSSSIILDKFSTLEKQKAFHSYPQAEIASWFDEPIPLKGMDDKKLLDLVKEKVIDTATNNLGPYMYAYVMAGGTQMSIIAEKLTATINQNLGKWHLGPAMNEIEQRVIKWTGELMGFDKRAAGMMVSGGSAANLAGLTIARNIFFEQKEIRKKGLFNQEPFIVYTSTEVHGCIDKSVEELGIGTDNLRKIRVDQNFKVAVEAMEMAIKQDLADGLQPFCIVATAGTVNTGAIDDLHALADLATKYNLWLHIDGAYGGLASSLDSIKEYYKGIERADSIAVDFHKWMYQTFEGGCVLVKDWDTLRRTYFKKASYLDTDLEEQGRIDPNEHYFQLSRNAKALKVWMSMKSYGVNRILEMIQKDIDLTNYLAERIEKSDDFELRATSHLAIACFRYKGSLQSEDEVTKINQALIPALEKDGRVFITGTKLNDEFVIRACLINHRMHKGTVDYLLNVIREVGDKIISKTVFTSNT